MQLYVFPSDSLEHIRIAVANRMWAVPLPKNPEAEKSRIGRALKMSVGALGLFYDKGTKSFTTPFIVESKPDLNRIVTTVWPGSWVHPFAIRPLGDPRWTRSLAVAKRRWPFLMGHPNASHVVAMQGLNVFSATSIAEADWDVILRDLAPLWEQSAPLAS